MEVKERILEVSEKLADNYERQGLFENDVDRRPPQRNEIINILKDIRSILFPGYYGNENTAFVSLSSFAANTIAVVYERLYNQIKIALQYKDEGGCLPMQAGMAEELTAKFIEKLPEIQDLVLKDVDAMLEGDPAAGSREEIILAYPGIFAIYVYRVAHVLYQLNVPLIPRIMSEYAHSNTGIDINPGADIGDYFFIDHGTGIVIGETCTIGSHVKIYQGVTLGALSLRKGQALSGTKRHPTIEDNVVIYSNTTILGGDTVIGKNSVVAGNTFITESIPENTKVASLAPKLQIKQY